eukprot:c2566_g1_i2.p2 GENE.c2566_g1_i2~~c2566_g1_i2.p2  ORF type:complete len:217 (+),score=33.22 c2566_g1_i2:1511-2161(+)
MSQYSSFKRTEDAKAAADNLDGFELGGRKLKVSLMPTHTSVMQAVVSNGRELDGVDGNGGLIHSAESRAMLMAKLQRGDMPMPFGVPGMVGMSPATSNSPAPMTPGALPAVLVPTPCILLRNMFDPDSETKEEDFSYADIEEDVKDECRAHGTVTHIHAVPQSLGLVFVRFKSTSSAQAARSTLNARWFGGKQIIAEFVDPALYDLKYPKSNIPNN